MRFATVGMIALGLVIAAGLNAWAQPGQAGLPGAGPEVSEVAGNGQPQRDEQSGMIVVSAMVGDNRQQVTVVDPRTQSLAVYHIELATGTVELMSARKIQWDLQMVQFNAKSPLPQELRTKIEQLR